MTRKIKPLLDPKKRYLQIALNSTLQEARQIIKLLPRSDRILLEAGTPLIKRYGQEGIRKIYTWYQQHLNGQLLGQLTEQEQGYSPLGWLFSLPLLNQPIGFNWRALIRLADAVEQRSDNITVEQTPDASIRPYIVADLKTMDRGGTEVD